MSKRQALRVAYVRAIIPVVVALLLFPARSTRADPALTLTSPPLSVAQVVRTVLAQNPALIASVCEHRGVGLEVRRDAARYGFIMQLDSSWTHLSTPTLSPGATPDSGIVARGKQDTFGVGAQLSKHLLTGADLSLRLDVGRQYITQVLPLGPPVGTIESRLGPGYGAGLKLSATQPLLRGAGRAVAEADLRAARVRLTTAELQSVRTASEVLRDALIAYWESWYAATATAIERHSRDAAVAQRDEADARIRTGSLAPVEGLTFDNQVSSRKEDVLNAETLEARRLSELARILGMVTLSTALNIPSDAPDEPRAWNGDLRDEALAASPELRALESQVKLATVQAETLGDDLRPRLDLDGYVQAQGLGYKDATAAVDQVSHLNAVSAHVGLTFQLPLDDTQHRSERERAIVAIQTSRYRLEEGRQLLIQNLDVAMHAEAAARSRGELTQQTLAIALQRADAEQKRYATGSSTAVQVIDAQNAVRAAELRNARTRADLVQAHFSVAHLAGRLLGEIAQSTDLTDDTACSAKRAPQPAPILSQGNF